MLHVNRKGVNVFRSFQTFDHLILDQMSTNANKGIHYAAYFLIICNLFVFRNSGISSFHKTPVSRIASVDINHRVFNSNNYQENLRLSKLGYKEGRRKSVVSLRCHVHVVFSSHCHIVLLLTCLFSLTSQSSIPHMSEVGRFRV